MEPEQEHTNKYEWIKAHQVTDIYLRVSLTSWAWVPGWAACWALPVKPTMCCWTAWGMSVCLETPHWSCRWLSDMSAPRCTRAKASGKRGAGCFLPAPHVGLVRQRDRDGNEWALFSRTALVYYVRLNFLNGNWFMIVSLPYTVVLCRAYV